MLSYSVSKIGRSQNSQDVQHLKFPPITSPVELKSQAFNFFSDSVEGHLRTLPFTEVSPFLTSSVPVASGAALQETLGVAFALRQAFRTVSNFNDHAFLSSDGDPISLNHVHLIDPSKRPPGITTYRFRATIQPSKFHDALADFCPKPLVFSLALPQSQVATAHSDPTSRFLFPDPSDVDTPSSLNNDYQAVGLRAGTDTIANYTTDVLEQLSQKQLRALGKRSRAKRDTGSEPSPMATVSPTMRGILQANAVITTYTGTFSFIDEQPAFDLLFPTMEPILPADRSPDLPTATLLSSFIDQCCNHVLLHLLRLDYVGTLDTDSAMSTYHVTKTIRAFRSQYYDKALKRNVTITPDQLYESYVSMVPMLPAAVSSWGLTLAHQYHSALSEDVKQRLVRDKEYTLPDPASLLTKVSQLAALRKLRSAASIAQFQLADDIRITNRLIQSSMQRSPRANVTDVVAEQPTAPLLPPAFVSPAEETMRRYSPPANPVFGVDPVTGYVGRYPTSFRGCLGCGNAEHTFKQCPAKDDPETKKSFFRELFCIKPGLRKRPPDEAEMEIARQQQQRNASALPIQATDTTAPTPADPARVTFDVPVENADNTPHMFTVTVPIFHERSESRPPMPVAIDNGLPHISIHLGVKPGPSGDQPLDLEGILDTCSALNTGYDKFHFWLASMYPHCVAELIHCDDPDKPFEALRLLGVNADNNTLSTHGQLTSVIRYYSSYTQRGRPVILSFALGPDVSTNTIIGLPTIDSFGLSIDLRTNRAHSSFCDTTFDIRRACVSHGLPPGVSFDLDHFRRTSQRVGTSATHHFGSGDVTVNDSFNRGCLNRTLTYLPLDSGVSATADTGPL
jgi:hypothetical protein